MPIAPTYPGVYIEEIASGVRTITGVATSITAFVGYTARGRDNEAKRIFGFADFERTFGGLSSDSELSYAVQHFFANGGGEAYVVRVPKSGSIAASIKLKEDIADGAKETLKATALSKGVWANDVLVDVDYDSIPSTDTTSFNMTVTHLATSTIEVFKRLKPSNAAAVINNESSGSKLIALERVDPSAGRPAQTGTIGGDLAIGASGELSEIIALDADKEWKLRISSDIPTSKISNVEVTFLEAGAAKPTSVPGVCRLLERKINSALDTVLKGARVRCVPSNTGKGIRILADFDRNLPSDPLDAILTFAPAASDSALGPLKLTAAAATVNVAHYRLGKGRAEAAQSDPVPGTEGTGLPRTDDLIGTPAQFTGIYALEKVDLFNILCIPDATRADADDPSRLDSYDDAGVKKEAVNPNSIFDAAMSYCQKRRAFLLVDPPPTVKDVDSAFEWKVSGLTVKGNHGAAYFPRPLLADPRNDFKLRAFAPCGVIAGVYARTDSTRGVWKAPAGSDASLNSVQGYAYRLNDPENGALNPMGLNCLRNFPVYGNVVWGARTLEGADQQASEWKYVSVRRTALFLEESLYRGLKWVVFEPNDEPLWAQIRLNVGAFLQNLFRQGAFAGKTPREAYFVKCDKETTTQNDVNLGIVNILVGFAPLKPAEFVIVKLQQMAGQVQT